MFFPLIVCICTWLCSDGWYPGKYGSDADQLVERGLPLVMRKKHDCPLIFCCNSRIPIQSLHVSMPTGVFLFNFFCWNIYIFIHITLKLMLYLYAMNTKFNTLESDFHSSASIALSSLQQDRFLARPSGSLKWFEAPR